MNPSPTPGGSYPCIVLASTSAYRRELLGRLSVAFESINPHVAEAHIADEPPGTRASRLAREKSMALAAQYPDAVLIGSDQVAEVAALEYADDIENRSSIEISPNVKSLEIFDKPGTVANAINTLLSLRGKSVNFHTAVCLHHPASQRTIEHTDITSVDVRADLTQAEIERYVNTDDPLDCAGAFKVESLGIALFTAVRTNDPTALVGLPLIAVAKALRSFGVPVP